MVEVDHREEAIVKAQADEELQSRPGPGNPEGQEREGKERSAAGECLQTLQDHLRGRDLGPRPEQSNTDLNEICTHLIKIWISNLKSVNNLTEESSGMSGHSASQKEGRSGYSILETQSMKRNNIMNRKEKC